MGGTELSDGMKNRIIRLSDKDKEQEALRLYIAMIKILNQGYDVELKKIKDHIKVSRVTRQTETEMYF